MLYDVNMTDIVISMHDYMVMNYILFVCLCYYWWIAIQMGRLLLCVNPCCLWSQWGHIYYYCCCIEWYGYAPLCRVTERGVFTSSKWGTSGLSRAQKRGWSSKGGPHEFRIRDPDLERIKCWVGTTCISATLRCESHCIYIWHIMVNGCESMVLLIV